MRKFAWATLLGILVLAGSSLMVAQRFRGGFGGMGWAHNYPNSEEHINQFRLGINFSLYSMTH